MYLAVAIIFKNHKYSFWEQKTGPFSKILLAVNSPLYSSYRQSYEVICEIESSTCNRKTDIKHTMYKHMYIHMYIYINIMYCKPLLIKIHNQSYV